MPQPSEVQRVENLLSTVFRSPLRYPGGKQRAIRLISAMLPERIAEYREPMVGGGSVYLHARSVGLADKYWINDKFRDLVLFWKAVKNPETCARLQADLTDLRRRYSSPERLKKYYLQIRKYSPADAYDAALRFFFFNRITFSGTTEAGGFSSAASTLRFTQSSIDRLSPLPEALEGTKITNVDFRTVIERPGDDVFLFLDPPYWTASRLYGKKGILHEFPHEELASLLQTTPHKFLITYDNCKQIRDLYRWANLETASEVKVQKWRLTYGMNNCNRSNTCRVGSELFISNY